MSSCINIHPRTIEKLKLEAIKNELLGNLLTPYEAASIIMAKYRMEIKLILKKKYGYKTVA